MRRARRLVVVLALLAGMLVSLTPAANAAIPTIRYGDRGYSVQIWQDDLNFWLAHGGTQAIYNDGANWITSIASDGIFGAKTDYVTTWFQAHYNLRADGIVGSQTRGKMCSFLSHWSGSNKQGFEPLVQDLLTARDPLQRSLWAGAGSRRPSARKAARSSR